MIDEKSHTPDPSGASADFKFFPTDRIGAYRLLERLGHGGMGEVYRAIHEVTERMVALKVVDIDDNQLRHHLEQVTREAMAMASLRDPTVVTCYSFGEDGRKLFLALELMSGGDTARMIEERGQPFSEAMIRSFAISCASGLAAIHRIGLVHRDIKPSNILLDAAGDAKLSDFGLASFREVEGKEPSRNDAGTPEFMSPESILGVNSPDIRGDIYSLGVTMYFWATCTSPYLRSSGYLSMLSVIEGGAPPPRSRNPLISEDLASIITRAMQRDRELRFLDPESMLAALNGRDVSAPPAPPSIPAQGILPQSSRRRVNAAIIAWTGIGAVILSVGLLVAVFRTARQAFPNHF